MDYHLRPEIYKYNQIYRERVKKVAIRFQAVIESNTRVDNKIIWGATFTNFQPLVLPRNAQRKRGGRRKLN